MKGIATFCNQGDGDIRAIPGLSSKSVLLRSLSSLQVDALDAGNCPDHQDSLGLDQGFTLLGCKVTLTNSPRKHSCKPQLLAMPITTRADARVTRVEKRAGAGKKRLNRASAGHQGRRFEILATCSSKFSSVVHQGTGYTHRNLGGMMSCYQAGLSTRVKETSRRSQG